MDWDKIWEIAKTYYPFTIVFVIYFVVFISEAMDYLFFSERIHRLIGRADEKDIVESEKSHIANKKKRLELNEGLLMESTTKIKPYVFANHFNNYSTLKDMDNISYIPDELVREIRLYKSLEVK